MEKKLSVDILDTLVEYAHVPSIRDARLVYIRGTGALDDKPIVDESDYRDYRCIHVLTLNGVPLMQLNCGGCPTCGNILATGYGIEKADSEELKSIREDINGEFVSLEDSIGKIRPLLTLLKTGLYVIADGRCYPTDGTGHFFWDVPNAPVESAATASQLMSEYDFVCVEDQPVYLYPTQSTDCYNAERVRHYVERFRETAHRPRAIVMHECGFVNAVLDGHHKACAAALLGEPLDCILILPLSGYQIITARGRDEPSLLDFAATTVEFLDIPEEYRPRDEKFNFPRGTLDLQVGSIIGRTWEARYRDSAESCPDVRTYSGMLAKAVLERDDMAEEM